MEGKAMVAKIQVKTMEVERGTAKVATLFLRLSKRPGKYPITKSIMEPQDQNA